MRVGLRTLILAIPFAFGQATSTLCADEFAVELPAPVKAVWEFDRAEHVSTATRERVCINGLWRWQPAQASAREVPTKDWGFFKVPGCWPGITDYEQKDCQTVYGHPSWKDEKLAALNSAWYEREINVPKSWSVRRIVLAIEHLNSYAAVFIDGKQVGEVRFPGGEVDLSLACKPGQKQRLSLLVVAMPLEAVLVSYQDTNAARQVRGTVNRRGLCGDVYLVSMPAGPRTTDTRLETSVRRDEITLDVALDGLTTEGRYSLMAAVAKPGGKPREFKSPAFKHTQLKDGRFSFTSAFKPAKLWDTDSPQNLLDLSLSLVDADNRLLDAAAPTRFGFREFWIDGRDFYLNGKRIHLSAVPLDNAQIGATWATYDAARESFARLRSFGINFVYTHNYGCEPGSHLSFAEILRAADDAGMLVSFSQPHFSHYDWKKPDADRANGYTRHAEFYVRAAQNHPSVVAYSMSHNATGYDEDMNPDMIDGLTDPRDQWSQNNAKLALRAEAIVKRLDTGRIVYHHASGNLGSMHDSNFYPNFVPVQELCDWFEHWATKGVKPMFTCEFGAPFSWDWGMYRGWFKGQREWGSAKVPWEFCLAEWNAQFLGDRAYQISENEKANLRWEAKQFNGGVEGWHRWDYPKSFSSSDLDERYPVFAMYLTDAWRAFRTWGVSAISPWEHELFWKLRPGVDRRRVDLKTDWDHLQRSGFSPDYIAERYERFDLAFEKTDWIPTAAAEALLHNNRPLLAYIAGSQKNFTSKDHNFLPGETVEKQIIVINDSRQPIECDCRWTLALPEPFDGQAKIAVQPGGQERQLLVFKLPQSLPPGQYKLRATMAFDSGERQEDSFTINVLPHPFEPQVAKKVALFDPQGETGRLLKEMLVEFQPVGADDDLSHFDMLVIGKKALSVERPAPAIERVRDGLRVLVFEQTADVLEKRLGLRVEEYGLRNVFPRMPDRPLLAGLGAVELRDWRGEATLTTPRLKYELKPRLGPTVQWCGMTVPHLWRCGNRGNVASVLIEKPTRGEFLPFVDGGYSLQYSPLLEYREGHGMVLFCQLDVTGRTESDPAAATLARRMLDYVATWKPTPRRQAVYAGDPAGRTYLESLGISARAYKGEKLSTEQALILGPGGGKELAASAATIADWLKADGRLVAFGAGQQDIAALLPNGNLGVKHQEHIAAYFPPPTAGSALAGISPADVHNRDPRELPLISSGAKVLGDGILAEVAPMNAAFFQAAPWEFAGQQANLRKTARRFSFVASRLLANAGVASTTPLLARFGKPVAAKNPEQRWLDGLYTDKPEEWDDPYRFFRW